jgi:hypothetical protein
MDPYLERRWGDVHNRLIASISATLQPSLPGGLRARGEQDIRLEDDQDPAGDLLFEGDIAVVETAPSIGRRTIAVAGGTAVLNEPVQIRMMPVIERHKWVQIIDTRDHNRVVTVIEILSPGNKSSSKLNERYRKKLNEYSRAGVSIVEIDLLRSSRSRLTIQSEDIEPARRAAYYTCVNWARDPFCWSVYPMSLRDPLPAIPIPCRDKDPDAYVSLQPLIDQLYIDGGHDDIDYGKPPEPPFDADDAAWAAELIHAARLS